MKKIKEQNEPTDSKPAATQPLRFAPIIRVSTEGQAEKGESLRTQEKQIREYVKKLEGVIPEHCWKYSGQEHATPEQERTKLDTLLQDSAKGLFDAVIVCDASRWSRDNRKSKDGLDTLRRNRIRFYIGTQEYSLNSPQHKLFIGMATEINEFVAEEQSRKSLENRIERAKRGIPTAGKYPHGRTFNKEFKLDDKDGKVTNIKRAAQRYLSGEGLPKIAADLGMNAANLWKILTKLSGDKWQIEFHSEKLNIHETVPMTIPRLLPQETIDAIHEKAKGNKTYNHGEIKHKYLLSRMIFCNHCGYTMFGQRNHSGKRYYRHARQDRRKNGCPSHRMYVPAEDMEKAILIQLFNMLGDVDHMEKAMMKAIPDSNKVDDLLSEKKNLEKDLLKVEQEKNNIVCSIGKGIITDKDAKSRMEKIREREQGVLLRLEQINAQLKDMPTKAQITEAAQATRQMLREITRTDAIRTVSTSYEAFEKMSYESKKKLIQHAFTGLTPFGRRRGVCLIKTDNPKKPFRYIIEGVLPSRVRGWLPMGKAEAQYLCHVATEYDDSNPLDVPVEKGLTKFTLSLQAQALP